MEVTLKFIFYITLCLVFSDLSFFIMRKVIRFSESLINTKFDFGKIKFNKKRGV